MYTNIVKMTTFIFIQLKLNQIYTYSKVQHYLKLIDKITNKQLFICVIKDYNKGNRTPMGKPSGITTEEFVNVKKLLRLKDIKIKINYLKIS
jgi:hypothetical protein